MGEVNILGVRIDESLLTSTMKKTDWRPEPITNIHDVNQKWIGSHRYQIGPTLLWMLFDTERELRLIDQYTKRRDGAQSLADMIRDHGRGSGDPTIWDEFEIKAAKQELLGDLRTLFIVCCLLKNDEVTQ